MSYAIFRGEGIKTLNELSQKGSHNKREKKNINLILILELKTVKTILK